MNLIEREELMLASAVGGFLLILLLFRLLKSSDRLPSLVLTEYRVSNTLQQGRYVTIAGRPEGLWAWILSVCGMGVHIRFEVLKSSVQLELEHSDYHIIDSVPIQNLASTGFGSTKKGFFLILATLLLVIGLSGIAMITFLKVKPNDGGIPALALSISCGVGSLICFIGYFLSKRLMIQIETAGGRFIGVRFKPSIVGHLSVNLEEASKVIQIVNSLVARGPTP